LPEADLGRLCGDLRLLQHGEISLFGFGWRDVSDRLQKAPVVKPIDPFEGGELDGLQRSPRSAAADHLAFVETVDGLGEGVVIAVADAADGGFDTGFNRRSVYLIETYWLPRSL
jgi:hypothetical protein